MMHVAVILAVVGAEQLAENIPSVSSGTTAVEIFVSLAGLAFAAVKGFDFWKRLMGSKYARAEQIIEAGVVAVYHEWVQSRKASSEDGKLTDEEKAKAREDAKTKAFELAKTQGVDLLKSLKLEDEIYAAIERAVSKQQAAGRAA